MRSEDYRCWGFGKSKRHPASHSERWFPCAVYPSVVAEDEGQVEEVPGHERGSSLVVAKGSATITATTDGVSGNASVTVVAELQEEVGE